LLNATVLRAHRLQRSIHGRIEALNVQIEETTAEIAEMNGMRQVVHETAERFRFEKDYRSRAFEDLRAANEKVCAAACVAVSSLACIELDICCVDRWSTCLTTSKSL
jgi:hypothetical protein